MAFSHPLFASPNHLTSSPRKISGNLEAILIMSKHDYCTPSHIKTRVTATDLEQNIHTSENSNRKDSLQIRHATALEELKGILISNTRQNAVDGIYMVDAIQRLGIEHLFKKEIEEALQRKHLMIKTHNYKRNDYHELSEVALQFRLLRQQGYYIHPDIFNKYLDDEGKLKSKFCDDIEGLIALFEASQLNIEGENCLDEAGEFCRQYLSALMSTFHDHPQAEEVANTLRYPTHKSLSWFMPTSSKLKNATWTSSLQELSKLETQIISSLHLKEILAVSKWWKDLGLAKELKYARDEPIKWYMWPMACLPDPQLSEERTELTKPLSLLYIVDDIFDCYGSIDELTLFTDAVKRWDLAATEQLPKYMKVCYKALYDITNEFAFKTQIKHGWNPIDTLKNSWVRLVNAFLEEAKWFASGHLPKAEDYLNNGIVSTGMEMVLVHAFILMGQYITNKHETLMDQFPSLISSTATILRLCDDMEGDKDDKQNGNDGSYLKCYMNDHPGISIEQTREHMNHQISDAWKRLNKECLTSSSNQLPSCFAKLCQNTARMVPLMYSYDGNSPSKLEEHVKSLLCGGVYIQSSAQQENQTVVV